METVSIALGILAGAIQLLAYYVYAKKVQNPNTASWIMWSISAVLDLGSYQGIAHDWAKSALPLACTIASIWLTMRAFLMGRLGRPDRKDLMLLGLDGIITIVWVFSTATIANVLYQATSIISFTPLIRGVANRTEHEHPLPWVLWTIAYTVMLVAVVMRIDSWAETAYPIVNIILHGLVLAFIVRNIRTPP